jgi:hypothetical protein
MGVAGELMDGVAAVFGIRRAPEPPHAVLARPAPGIELRRYGVRGVYESRVAASGPDRAFGRLFRTIAGGNAVGQRIAMTAPVENAPTGEGRAMRFFLPEGLAAPAARDPLVRVAEVPAATYAVRRFAGLATPARLAAEERTLRAAMAAAGWEAAGPAVTWFYDPPFTPPPLRRTEVAVRVADG